MESKFIKDVEEFAQLMAGRLPVTHEGGIIIIAVDDEQVAKCIIATPTHRKEIAKALLEDEDIQQSFAEIMSETETDEDNEM